MALSDTGCLLVVCPIGTGPKLSGRSVFVAWQAQTTATTFPGGDTPTLPLTESPDGSIITFPLAWACR